MKNEMKALFAEGNGNGKISVVPIPQLGEKNVLIKVAYCGVCGTDQDLFSGDCSFSRNGQVTYPVRLGHEWSGTVEKVGNGVTSFKPGDRVVGDNAIACGECADCLGGHYDQCRNMRNVGTIDPAYDGAFAEYIVYPEMHLYQIPDDISLRDAALSEPFSVAYGGIKHMDISSDSHVAVIGTGCIALSAAILAKCQGAKNVILIGRNPEKLRVAKELGIETVNVQEQDPIKAVLAKTNDHGADYVLECSGARGAFMQAMYIAAKKGTIALIGFYENTEKELNVDVIVSKSLTLFGIMGEFGNMEGALRALRQYKPNLSPIITQELSFEECLPAFLRKNNPSAIKTMIRINR